MTEGLEAITARVLGLALDAASLRQQAIAANIANANTADYVPVRVSFESQLDEARRVLQEGRSIDASSLVGVEPRLERAGLEGTGLPVKVMLDVEVANLAQNSVHYQALVKGLSKHYAVLSAAVSDGKK